MKKILICILFITRSVSAQIINIHDHPEKLTYNGSERFCYSSQGQWQPSQAIVTNGNLNPTFGHFHLDRCVYQDGELNSTYRVDFTLQIFHTAGKIIELHGNHARDFVFDSGGLPLIGDVNGLVIETGHYTFDPFKGDGTSNILYGSPKHGYALDVVELDAQLDNTDFERVTQTSRYWSMIDPSVTPAPFVGDGAVSLRTEVSINSSRDSKLGGGLSPFGTSVVEFRSNVPLGPINYDWIGTYPSNSYNYGSITTGELGYSNVAGVFDIRKDMNLHMGIPGDPIGGYLVNDLGVGDHKIAFTWHSTSGTLGTPHVTPNEDLWSLLVLPITVSNNIVANPIFPLFNSAKVLSVVAPESLNPGQQFGADITILNSGTTTWNLSKRYFLRPESPHNSTDWGDFFWTLPIVNDVKPGQRTIIHVNATAPNVNGLKSFGWGMQQESVESFGSIGQMMIHIGGPVIPPPVITCSDPVNGLVTTTVSNWVGGINQTRAITVVTNQTRVCQ